MTSVSQHFHTLSARVTAVTAISVSNLSRCHHDHDVTKIMMTFFYDLSNLVKCTIQSKIRISPKCKLSAMRFLMQVSELHSTGFMLLDILKNFLVIKKVKIFTEFQILLNLFSKICGNTQREFESTINRF